MKTKNWKLKISFSWGFSTLELMIAMAVIVTAISTVILVVFGNQKMAVDNQLNNSAVQKGSEMIESARASARIDFNGLSGTTTITDDIYTKILSVNDINPCKKNVVSSVNWNTDPSRPQAIEFNTSITNSRTAVALGGDCGPDAGDDDWIPLVCDDNDATFDFTPAGVKGKAVDLIKRGDSKYALLASEGNAAAQPDFWVVDVTSRSNPPEVSSINTTDESLSDIDAFSNYAFTANNDDDGQLQVIDIANLSMPSIVATRSLYNITSPDSQGKKIFYYNKKIYIATDYMDFGAPGQNEELQVFDVTDPTNPTFSGSYNVNHNIYDIFVRNEVIAGNPKTIAYLALSATAAGSPELMVLDVTDPSAIAPSGPGFNAEGFNQYGTAIYILGNVLYLGREKGSGVNYDLYVLDVSNHASISVLDSALLGLANNTEVRAIIVSGGYAFIATSDSGSPAFQIWNIKDPTNIARITSCNYPQKPEDLDFDGTNIYVTNGSNEGLRILYDGSP